MDGFCPDCHKPLPSEARACQFCPWDPTLLNTPPSDDQSATPFTRINIGKPLLLAAFILSGFFMWRQRTPGDSVGYNPNLDATDQISAAVSQARGSGRRVFIEVGGDWCSWCHHLEDFFAAEPELKKFLNDHYVVVKINVSPDKPNSVPLARFPAISGYPHFFVLEQDGSLLVSQISDEFEAPGYTYDHARFASFLSKWARP